MYKFFSAPPDGAPTVRSIKFQTADFPIFCARIIVIFWTTCVAREVFAVTWSTGSHCYCFYSYTFISLQAQTTLLANLPYTNILAILPRSAVCTPCTYWSHNEPHGPKLLRAVSELLQCARNMELSTATFPFSRDQFRIVITSIPPVKVRQRLHVTLPTRTIEEWTNLLTYWPTWLPTQTPESRRYFRVLMLTGSLLFKDYGYRYYWAHVKYFWL